MRAQVAFEYMLIVIMALAFLIPLWTYVTKVEAEASGELTLAYAKSSVERLASTADLIYSQGAPAKVKVSIYIPDAVAGYNITNYTINIKVLYMGTVSDVFAVSRARLNGTLPTTRGSYWMEVQAVEGEDYDVYIRQV